MIFVTVGTQLGFDRLVRAMDEWAARNRAQDVFIQRGKSAYTPLHCRSVAYTTHQEWELFFQAADRVVSHAGMGTILKSLDYAKPLIVMPREAALGEHRNDHQRATVARFAGFGNIRTVTDAEQLAQALAESSRARSAGGSASASLDNLLGELRRFIQGPQQGML